MKLRKHILAVTLSFSYLLIVTPAQALAQSPWAGRCLGSTAISSVNATDVATIAGSECLVANLLQTAITLIGIVAFVMFLVGGFQYLTAGSNSKGVESGKNSLTFAIIGIIVALSSVIIIKLITSFTGLPVTTFLIFNTQLQ